MLNDNDQYPKSRAQYESLSKNVQPGTVLRPNTGPMSRQTPTNGERRQPQHAPPPHVHHQNHQPTIDSNSQNVSVTDPNPVPLKVILPQNYKGPFPPPMNVLQQYAPELAQKLENGNWFADGEPLVTTQPQHQQGAPHEQQQYQGASHEQQQYHGALHEQQQYQGASHEQQQYQGASQQYQGPPQYGHFVGNTQPPTNYPSRYPLPPQNQGGGIHQQVPFQQAWHQSAPTIRRPAQLPDPPAHMGYGSGPSQRYGQHVPDSQLMGHPGAVNPMSHTAFSTPSMPPNKTFAQLNQYQTGGRHMNPPPVAPNGQFPQEQASYQSPQGAPTPQPYNAVGSSGAYAV